MKTPEELRAKEEKEREEQWQKYLKLAKKALDKAFKKTDLGSDGGSLEIADPKESDFNFDLDTPLFTKAVKRILKEYGWLTYESPSIGTLYFNPGESPWRIGIKPKKDTAIEEPKIKLARREVSRKHGDY